MQQDIIIKFCVVGQPSVGKTSMLYRYVHQKFDEKVRPTIGCDFTTKLKSNIDGKTIRLQLWDIAGQERFNSVSKMYLRGAIGCIIVCSSQNIHTLQETIKWKKIIQENSDFGCKNGIPCILVQNKIDLINMNQIQDFQRMSYLQKFAKQNKFNQAIQTSAKTNTKIQDVFKNLLEIATNQGLLKQQSNNRLSSPGNSNNNNNSIKLQNHQQISNKQNTIKKKKCC